MPYSKYKVMEEELQNFLASGDVGKIFDMFSPNDEHKNFKASNCQLILNEGGLTLSDDGDQDDWDPLLSWFRPSRCCVEAISAMVTGSGLRAVTSVGCGTGLLEALLAKVAGFDVTGYEVNESWWASPYSPRPFIPLTFVESGQFSSVSADQALLFCYFNNGEAFRRYLSNYEGECLIIVGSLSKSRYTVPAPLDLIGSREWIVQSAHAQSNGDLICCYSRSRER